MASVSYPTQAIAAYDTSITPEGEQDVVLLGSGKTRSIDITDPGTYEVAILHPVITEQQLVTLRTWLIANRDNQVVLLGVDRVSYVGVIAGEKNYQVERLGGMMFSAALRMVGRAPSAPDPVLDISALSILAAPFRIEFSDPADNGSPITLLQVQWREDDEDWDAARQRSLNAGITMTDIAGLSIGELHHARARAQNVHGWGAWGRSVSSPVRGRPEQVLGLGLLTITRETEAVMYVAWFKPDDNAAPLSGYEVEYREETTVIWIDAAHAGTRAYIEVDGLDLNQPYEFRARAQNEFGFGAWSATVSGRLIEGNGTMASPYVLPNPLGVQNRNILPFFEWKGDAEGSYADFVAAATFFRFTSPVGAEVRWHLILQVDPVGLAWTIWDDDRRPDDTTGNTGIAVFYIVSLAEGSSKDFAISPRYEADLTDASELFLSLRNRAAALPPPAAEFFWNRPRFRLSSRDLNDPNKTRTFFISTSGNNSRQVYASSILLEPMTAIEVRLEEVGGAGYIGEVHSLIRNVRAEQGTRIVWRWMRVDFAASGSEPSSTVRLHAASDSDLAALFGQGQFFLSLRLRNANGAGPWISTDTVAA